MKHTSGQRAALRRPLAAVVVAGFAVAGCAANPSTAPGAASPPPAVRSTPPGQPQGTALTWASSMCQALQPAFSQLGTPPQPDANNPAATRQAFVTYLTNAANAAQQTIDRLPSIGAPPVDNGKQILDQLRTQLTQLRTNLTNAATQLQAANPNEAAAIGQAVGAAGNLVGVITTLGTNPQLRAALDQAPDCQNLAAANGR